MCNPVVIPAVNSMGIQKCTRTADLPEGGEFRDTQIVLINTRCESLFLPPFEFSAENHLRKIPLSHFVKSKLQILKVAFLLIK